jgi:hypothetical protein
VCQRWYCKYGISYRDLSEMMQERSVEVEPSTIMRWVHRYAPELEKRVHWYLGCRATILADGRDICEGWWQVEIPVPRRR